MNATKTVTETMFQIRYSGLTVTEKMFQMKYSGLRAARHMTSSDGRMTSGSTLSWLHSVALDSMYLYKCLQATHL